MLEQFYPDEYLDSTYDIDFKKFYEKGYRGIIFDIDNTLVPHGAPADRRAEELFQRLKELGYSCCLLSNNQRPRVERFNEKIQVYFIEKRPQAFQKELPESLWAYGDWDGQYAFCGRSAFYGCLGRQAKRNLFDSG